MRRKGENVVSILYLDALKNILTPLTLLPLQAMSEVKASKKSWESIITSLRTYLDVPPDTTKPPSTSIDTLESEEAETTGKKKKAKRKKKKKR